MGGVEEARRDKHGLREKTWMKKAKERTREVEVN